MKKRSLPFLIAVIAALLLLPLSGCGRYSSHYKAVAFVHTNTAKNASMSFSSFEGSMVFQLKCGSAEEKINYSAKLETGSAEVYYDCDGTKTKLFSVNSGGDVSETEGVLQTGTVYIIVETSEPCKNGHFDFNVT